MRVSIYGANERLILCFVAYQIVQSSSDVIRDVLSYARGKT